MARGANLFTVLRSRRRVVGGLPLNFLADPRAVGDGTKVVAYDAEFSTVLDAPGGSVSDPSDPAGSISDLFGLEGPAVQATVGARPTWLAAAINGRPALSLDGGDRLVLAAFSAGAITQPYTRVKVVKYGSLVADAYTGDGGAAINTGVLRIGASPTFRWTLFAGALLASATDGDTNVNLHVSLYNGASAKHWLNNAEIASGNAGTVAPNGITMGGRQDGAFPLPANSLYAFDVIYLGDIGAAARQFLFDAATARFGTLGT